MIAVVGSYEQYEIGQVFINRSITDGNNEKKLCSWQVLEQTNIDAWIEWIKNPESNSDQSLVDTEIEKVRNEKEPVYFYRVSID